MQSNTVATRQDWWTDGFPDGIPVSSSMVITGESGTGKPILALGLVASWLDAGGGVISAPLQFPDPDYVDSILQSQYGIDRRAYAENFVHVAFDPDIDGVEKREHGFAADLVWPDSWQQLLERATPAVEDDGPGVLVFSTALNLPLLSPTYADALHETFVNRFDDPSLTTLYCVSRSMNEKRARDIEAPADVLIEATVREEPKRLEYHIERATDVSSVDETIETPFPPEELVSIETLADQYRVTPVETVRSI